MGQGEWGQHDGGKDRASGSHPEREQAREGGDAEGSHLRTSQVSATAEKGRGLRESSETEPDHDEQGPVPRELRVRRDEPHPHAGEHAPGEPTRETGDKHDRPRHAIARSWLDPPWHHVRCAPVSAHHSIEMPTVGHALQLVLAGVFEPQAGSGDEILHGLGDEDL